MTRAEKAITKHIGSANGLTSPGIAADVTGYKVSTCIRVYKEFAEKEGEFWFLKEG